MSNNKKSDHVTSRRNILRGTALAGAAAIAAGATRGSAAPMRSPVPSTPMVEPGVIKAQANAMTKAAPADLSGYERVKQRLVAPPFAPEHDQIATGAPKIVEIEMNILERLMVVDEDTGASIWALTYNGSVPGPLIIVHQDDYVELTLRNSGRQPDGAQHRLSRLDGCAWRRWSDPCLSRRRDRVALESDKAGCLHLSLRPRWRDDPLPRLPRDERGGDGAAARRSEGRSGQSAAL